MPRPMRNGHQHGELFELGHELHVLLLSDVGISGSA